VAFDVPGVDWPCPHGKPWGFRLSGRPGAGDSAPAARASAGNGLAAKRAAICAACDEPECSLREWFSRLTPCGRRTRLARPGYACPHGCW